MNNPGKDQPTGSPADVSQVSASNSNANSSSGFGSDAHPTPPPLPGPGPIPPPWIGTGSSSTPGVPGTTATIPQSRRGSTDSPLTLFLSLMLVLFLVDGALSLFDDLLIVVSGSNVLSGLRGMSTLLMLGLSVATYVAMGFTPRIPKKVFLPLVLFNPVLFLAAFLLAIYWFYKMPVIAVGLSLIQILLGVYFLKQVLVGQGWRWPLVREDQLGVGTFRWGRLVRFAALNGVVVIPCVMIYLVGCGVLAVEHFSGGFVKIRWQGMVMRSTEYVNGEGKRVQLMPMMHVGDAAFYEEIEKDFPTNSVILMEGVTDVGNRLKRKVGYKRMADKLGLVEQKDSFEPKQGEVRRADVDLGDFSKESIALLEVSMQFHAEGFTPEVASKMMNSSRDPRLIQSIWDDLLTKRNLHLVEEMKKGLEEFPVAVVPWGAAHMPGIAAELEKLGYRQEKTRDYIAVRWSK